MDKRLLEEFKLTAEIYGRTLSDAAAAMILLELDRFPAAAVSRALSKCRLELRTFPTLADIVARIDDGRPGVEQAWAMLPKNESDSVVWTAEMAEAHGIVRSMIGADPVAARMAFKESYLAAVAHAREEGRRVEWTPSLGHDKRGRDAAIREAIDKGRLSLEYVREAFPELIEPPRRVLLSGPGEDLKPFNFTALLEQIKEKGGA